MSAHDFMFYVLKRISLSIYISKGALLSQTPKKFIVEERLSFEEKNINSIMGLYIDKEVCSTTWT